jgi:4-amino-4-deoxy-L-arabinose transferase-like glycosyltransferase
MTDKIYRFVSREKNALLLILLLALALRLYKLPSAFYGTVSELFRDLNVIYEFLVNGQWPLLGPSASVGQFYFGAVYYYILAPFVYLFHFQPLGAILVSTLFSLFSIWLFYKLLLLWFGRKDFAFIGSLLMVVSVYDIQNAYYISNPNPLPFFVLGLLYALTKVIQGSRHWAWYILLGLLFGVATQLHATALAILPPLVLAAILIRRQQISWTRLLWSAAVLVVTYVPYIIYESTHKFQNLKRIFQVGGQELSLSKIGQSIAAILNFWQSAFIFTNGFFNLWLDYTSVYVFLAILYLLVALFVVIVAKRQTNKAPAPKLPISQEGKLLLLLWAVIAIAVYLLFAVPKPLFYFLVVWPIPLILFAWLLIWLKTLNRKLFILLLSTYILAQVIQLGYFYGTVGNKFYEQKPLNNLMARVVTDAGDQSFNVINSNLDQNMFIYYNKVSGYDKLLTRYQPTVLYVLTSKISDYGEEAVPNPYTHQLVKDFSQDVFTVKKYLYTPAK